MLDSAAVQAICRKGLELHTAGHIAEAQQYYEQVLAAAPNHFEALHLSGVACIQTGQPERAVQRITQAIKVNPNVAAAHGNLANVLNGLQRFGEALASSDRAIALQPDFAQAHGNRAQALLGLGRAEEALASYAQVIALRPDAQAHLNEATALRELKRLDEAVASYDRAIALKPDYAEAHRGRAITLSDARRPGEAVESYDRVLVLRPADAEVHDRRGMALRALGRLELAVASHDQAIALRPAYAEAYWHRGNALFDLRRFEAALESYDRALALKPDYGDAHYNRGAALYELRRLEEALTSYRSAILLAPERSDFHTSEGAVLFELGRLDEALASYDRAILADPENADAHHNQAICRLKLGAFAEGWAQYEWRWKTAQFSGARAPAEPLWLGHRSLEGRTILLRGEQGLGDSLQFCRYVPDVAARGARIVLEVQPGLERLLGRVRGVDLVVTTGRDLPPYDFQTPLMSLPLALGIPDAGQAPYLTADPDEASAWSRRLAGSGALRVGLCWAGGARPDEPVAHGIDKRRSLPLQAFGPLSDLDGIQFYSLQKGMPAAQISEAAARGLDVPQIIDLTEDLKDFADTAAFVANLDLVITCDTAIAHLAGGLGKPVWILNRFDGCWRWMTDRDDSHWYSTARLFHQPTPGDWDSVIQDVRRELSVVAQARLEMGTGASDN